VQCTRSVFAPELMRECMGGSVPMVLTLPVDAEAMQHNLLQYACRDSANFSSHTGDHHTKLGDVFNVSNKANCRRIEEGVQDRQNPSNILGSVFKHDDPVLRAWNEAWTWAQHVSRDADEKPRQTMIVTGCCENLRYTEKWGPGLTIAKDKQIAHLHFDQYYAFILCLAGRKTFKVTDPEAISCTNHGGNATYLPRTPNQKGKTKTMGPQMNERPDIDASYCLHGKWMDIVLGPGDILLLPADWWHEVHLVCSWIYSAIASAGPHCGHLACWQVETGNSCSWTMTIWFRINDQEAPQMRLWQARQNRPLDDFALDSSLPIPADGASQSCPSTDIGAAQFTPGAIEQATTTTTAAAGASTACHTTGNVSGAGLETATAPRLGDTATPPISPRPRVYHFPYAYEMFKQGTKYIECRVDTVRPAATAARGLLDNIPQELLWKWSQVIKDQDMALRNATVTDVCVPEGLKIVSITCIAHVHMHVQKKGFRAQIGHNALAFARKWIKNIDEHNKVRCPGVCLLLHVMELRGLLWWCTIFRVLASYCSIFRLFLGLVM